MPLVTGRTVHDASPHWIRRGEMVYSVKDCNFGRNVDWCDMKEPNSKCIYICVDVDLVMSRNLPNRSGEPGSSVFVRFATLTLAHGELFVFS